MTPPEHPGKALDLYIKVLLFILLINPLYNPIFELFNNPNVIMN